jgi:PPE-repeat protein
VAAERIALGWLASPPEVHSALLSSGPGTGSLLAGSAAWSTLSAEYAAVADELAALLAAVQAAAWDGAGAEAFAAAHGPYLAWLAQASQVSTAGAARHEVVAAAYSAALATMPTLPELATNHAVHGMLVATNFFGINTIPITLNEVDYARMWVQAATAMATYEAVSDAAAASTVPTPPAPRIVRAAADDHEHEHEHEHEGASGPFVPLDNAVADVLRLITGGGVDWDPVEGTLNGVPFDDYTDATQPLWWVARTLELTVDGQNFLTEFPSDPAGAIESLVQIAELDFPLHLAQVAQAIGQSPQLLLAAFVPPLALAGGAGGLAGLAGLGGIPPAVPAPSPAGPAPDALRAAGVSSGSLATAPVSASAPTSTVTTTAGAGTAPTPSAPGSGAGGFGFPYLIGGPRVGPGAAMSTGAAASVRRKAPEPDSSTAQAAESATDRVRARRHARATRRDHGDEFMDATGEHGAGNVGFAGTVRKEPTVPAAGLTTLAADEFGGPPRMPMLPRTWGSLY